MTGEIRGDSGDAVGCDTAPLLRDVEGEHELVLQLLSSVQASVAASSNVTTTRTLPLSPPFPLLHVTKLDLPHSHLSELPSTLPEALPNLKILFLSHNRFRVLPQVIGQCPSLRMVAFKSNGMTEIPPEALQPQLQWLILTDNQLTYLPTTIGQCTNLQKLMLSGNRLRELPEELAQCQNLELIRLASNRLIEPPLTVLQALPRLSWVGLSQNPFLVVENTSPSTTPAASALSSLPVLDVDDQSGEVLGQGAGGIVRKVYWNDRYVAVKAFTGAMTSDGLAQAERDISCLVSQACHAPCFVQVLGETREGSLVLEYLPDYRPLASPPSLETCSRDVYNCGVQLTHEQTLGLVSVLLEGLVELHRAGLCHGDFYAHNILLDESGNSVRLTDFGAAFQYDRDSRYGKLIERIELRALAVLVEEIAQHVLVSSNDTTSTALFTDFVDICRQSAEKEQGFESPLIWWKQQRLQTLAKELDVELDNM